MLSDLLFFGYLGDKPDPTSVLEEIQEVDEKPVVEEDIIEEVTEQEVIDSEVELQSENLVNDPKLDESAFISAGFFDPVLKPTIYSGLVFQFISFSGDVDAPIYQNNLFNGENFIGSVYEVPYTTETGAFQGYLELREEAETLLDIGDVNEVNNYGDSSFYFNHKTKTKTVHLVVRSGSSVYAFEYAYTYHDMMTQLLKTIEQL